MTLLLAIEMTIYPRYNEKLLLPTKLPLDENNNVMKELNLIQ